MSNKERLAEGADLTAITVHRRFQDSRQEVAELVAANKMTPQVAEFALQQIEWLDKAFTLGGADAIDAQAVDKHLAALCTFVQGILDGRSTDRRATLYGQHYTQGRAFSLLLEQAAAEKAANSDEVDKDDDYLSYDLAESEPLAEGDLEEVLRELGIPPAGDSDNEGDTNRDN